MGCGGSKSSGARNDNPPIEDITVADLDPNYPPPTPPKNSKDEIYKPSEYTNIDARIKQQLPRINASTYETLIADLTKDCSTDLQKLRAIFVWLYHQNIHGSFYNGVSDPYTPRGYMKLIKTKNGSYASFFAQLCRSADIPCNVIRGAAKGDKYKVGQREMIGLDSAWNAVYVQGSWRLVHPLWAYFKEKQTYEGSMRPPAGTKRTSINEFFWLIDPNKMICFCRPHQDPWKLLKGKWDQQKFLNSPLFTEDYFTSELMLPKKYNSIINASNGLVILEFDHDAYAEPTVDAHVKFDQEMSGDRMPEDVRMEDYTIRANSSSQKSIIVRLPVRGKYSMQAFGGVASSKPKVVEFRLESEDVSDNPQPFPLRPADGFGMAKAANQFGISDLVPDSAIVQVKPREQRHFSFTCTQRLDAEARMFHNSQGSGAFRDFISYNCTDNKVDVMVIVPEETDIEFGLEIAVRPKGTTKAFTVVANYLLVDENWNRKTAVVKPVKTATGDEEKIRKALIEATHGDDIQRLEKAIEIFEDNGLSDNGDLTRARHKLALLHRQNLRKWTVERNLEELEKAIDGAKKSRVCAYVIDTKEMEDAEKVRRQLKRLRLNMHKVLQLKQSTISEIHSYHRPRPLVHSVMKATFRILGEPNKKIKDWPYIQSSMRQLGRNSMINRMRNQDVVHLKDAQVQDAEAYLGQTNKYLVMMTSAGAGTFYVWSNNMISEYQGKGDIDPAKIWPTTKNQRGQNTRTGADNNKTPYSQRTPRARRASPAPYQEQGSPGRWTPDRYDRDRYEYDRDPYDDDNSEHGPSPTTGRERNYKNWNGHIKQSSSGRSPPVTGRNTGTY